MHYQVPPLPPLLMFCVKGATFHSYWTGVDFASPLHVYPSSLTKSDNVWICLFTCLANPVVHLDTLIDLTADTVIHCLNRFAGRRSLPQMFLSDKGKTFKVATSFVKAAFKNATVQEYLAREGVKWKFNTV